MPATADCPNVQLAKSKPMLVRYACFNVTKYVSWTFQPLTVLTTCSCCDGVRFIAAYSGFVYELTHGFGVFNT